MSTPRPFSMSRFCSLWMIECEYERDGNLVYLWEPLHPPVPLRPNARPSWHYDDVQFYREGEKDWVHVKRHLMFSRGASPDVLCLKDGTWIELAGAQIMWRDKHELWFIRWHGYTNSRFAKLAQVGFEEYKK